MNGVLEIKNMRANLLTMEFEVGSKPVSLTPTEWKIMILLMSNPNRVVVYDEIFEFVWGWKSQNNQILNTNMNRLRKKIGKDKIDTIRGKGYILRAAK